MILLWMSICILIKTSPISGDAGNELSSLGREFFDWRMKVRPVQATLRGIYKYNDRVEKFTLSQMDENKDHAELLLSRLTNISPASLSRSEKITYKVLKNMLQTYIQGYRWRLYQHLNPMNFLEGPQNDPERFVDTTPFDTKGDYENYIVRLQNIVEQFREIINLFREAVGKNRTYHKVSVDRVIDQIDVAISDDVTESVYYKPFKDMLKNSSVPEGERTIYRRRGRSAVSGIRTAYGALARFFRTEYFSHTRPKISISSLFNGTEFYKACLYWYLSLDMTPESIHDLGLKEVSRIRGEMKKIVAKQNFNGSLAEYFSELMQDSKFFKDTGEEMLEEYQNLISKRIDPVLPKIFKNIPNIPIRVEAMPSDGPAGQYLRPSMDGSRPGVFLANLLRPKQTPTFMMLSLTMHETSPGHHLQTVSAMHADNAGFQKKMESVEKFRVPFAFPVYTAFTEGWALYAESLGEDLGLYKNDYELMGRYSSEMFRAARLVVDTGIHYYGWDREKAIEYFLKLTAKSRDSIAVEVDRYITWPGQACAYKIGELTIRKLRNMAEKHLGDRFDIKEFHARVLENGNVPLSVLEDHVKDWIRNFEDYEVCSSGVGRLFFSLTFIIFQITVLAFSVVVFCWGV